MTASTPIMEKALNSSSRKKLRKNLEATAGMSDIRMSVTDDATSFVDEIYPLYLQVFERSRMQFEKLTKDYFRQLGQRMNDKVRFFAWRRGNMLVAFSLCMVQGDSLYAEYVGFDYAVALDLHLYHYVVRDMINWGIGKGYKWFRSSGLNYDPKLHMRHRLDPIDLYVRHTSASANVKLALPGWCRRVTMRHSSSFQTTMNSGDKPWRRAVERCLRLASQATCRIKMVFQVFPTCSQF